MLLGDNHASGPFLGLHIPESKNYSFWGKCHGLPVVSPQKNTWLWKKPDKSLKEGMFGKQERINEIYIYILNYRLESFRDLNNLLENNKWT